MKADLERTRLQIELWKQTVSVQQHFNDIELKIRGLALTVLTFALGAAALAIRDAAVVELWGLRVQVASIVLLSSSIVWLAFYFVDQVWYHRLLVGAVKHGELLEDLIEEAVPGAGLTKSISASSPYRLKIGWRRFGINAELHSSQKIRLFYFVILALLVILTVVTHVAVEKPDPVTVPAVAATIDPGAGTWIDRVLNCPMSQPSG